ncbi:MAG: competence/damage-inducible protein A [Alphaproteobacteria bacterium]|nr:competence/damage-inducible protein A [Alphaproteobacteria bacterium]
MQSPTACLIIIGNEVLSGRTQDKNLAWIATELNKRGIRLMETRIIPDIGTTIITCVNSCRRQFDMVFTTGGIGPTHDDITSENIAKAFGVKLVRHPEAKALLEAHYPPDQINEARMKMADIPEGATLIHNPVSAAPGYKMDNVYVMAGVPRIMQAMFDNIKHTLAGGAPMLSVTVAAFVTEGTIAEALGKIQTQFPTVEIGSYPFVRHQKLGTSLVARSTDAETLAECKHCLITLFGNHTDEVWDEERGGEAL